jgi:hypothetical protein
MILFAVLLPISFWLFFLQTLFTVKLGLLRMSRIKCFLRR